MSVRTLGTSPAEQWSWLRDGRGDGPTLGVSGGAPVRAKVEDDGDLVLELQPGGVARLHFVFAPAMWGENRVRVGAELVVDASARAVLLERAAQQLDAPLPTSAAPSPPPLVDVHLEGVPGGFLCDTLLFSIEKPRGELWLHVAFTEDGAGSLTFRGPRGKKSRAMAVQLLAGFL
ncbi:MAG: hypothetical protein ACOZQL_32485 [Myxococcota bacterium]